MAWRRPTSTTATLTAKERRILTARRIDPVKVRRITDRRHPHGDDPLDEEQFGALARIYYLAALDRHDEAATEVRWLLAVTS